MADLDHPALDPDDRHHLERVLRLRRSEEITVCDGQGGWRPCRLGPELEPVGQVARDPRPSPAVEVAFALVKGERPEWVVQKLTELGADRMVPFGAARSVVRWDAERAARQVERLRRVAREAAGQCRRTWLPAVEEVATFDQVAARPGAVLADREGSPPWLAGGPVLVGPEGGWDDGELALGLPRMALGPHVLRAETAAVAVGALLAALRAGLVAPRSG
ncbi:MAG TPA: RsmE family RNA methyltransferase [Acidimicrobiales bacterium]|nr:RsmE family RNA methyltransferase [Acidimicrobiales bacterium]